MEAGGNVGGTEAFGVNGVVHMELAGHAVPENIYKMLYFFIIIKNIEYNNNSTKIYTPS